MRRWTENSAADAIIKDGVKTLYPTFVLTLIAASAATIIDHICASKLIGDLGVAAAGLVAPVNSLLWMFIHILAKGGQIITGKSLGRGDIASGKDIFNSVILLMFLTGSVVGALFFALCGPLASLLGASGDVLPYATAYLRGWAPGALFMLVYQAMAEFVTFDGGEKKLISGVMTITVCDAMLNLLFVKVLNLGMFGLGLATALASLAGLATLVPFFLDQTHCISLCPSMAGMKTVKQAVSVGLPGGYFEACSFILPTCINHLMMRHAGVAAVSAMAVTASIRVFMKSFVFAEGDICSTMGSVFYGERDERSLISVIRHSLSIGTCCTVIASLIVAALAGPIIALLSGGSKAVEQLAHPAVLFMLLHLIVFSVNLLIIKAYQVQEKKELVYRLNLLAHFIIPLLTGAMLIPALGAWGLWISWLISDLAVFLILYLINTRKHGGKISFSDLFTYGDHFGMSSDNRLSLSPGTGKDVADASEQIYRFCLEHGCDPKPAYYAALSTEELCMNILKHGFTGPDSKPRMCITMFFQDGKIHLRIRDDAKVFNPVEYVNQLKLSPEQDAASNIGLRIVASTASQMNYKNLFHTNTLEIVL